MTISCGLTDPGSWVTQTVELTLEKVGDSSKITCKTDTSKFGCEDGTSLGTYIPLKTTPSSEVLMTLTLNDKVTSTTAYRCTVKVGAVDEAATDTKLIYAQQIRVAYEEDDLEKYEMVKKDGDLKVSVYGHDAYALLSSFSTCKLGGSDITVGSEGKVTVPAATEGAALKLICTLKFDTDSSGLAAVSADDETITYTSPAIKVVAACSDGQNYVQSACADCPTNEYKPTSDSQFTGCRVCPAGEQPNGNRIDCVDCAVGKYSTAMTVCTDCPAGTKGETVKATSCAQCPAGKFQSSAGQNACESCLTRYYSDVPGAASCTQCPAGTIVNPDKTACVACDAGTFQTGEFCVSCATGKYSSAGSASCTLCPAGTKETGKTSCTPCDAGKYQDAAGETTCKDCPSTDNKYSVVAGSISCLTCQGNVAAGKSKCQPCDAGQKYDGTACVDCGVGEVSEAGSGSCSPCPPGQKKETAACVECPAGTKQRKSAQETCDKCNKEKGEYQTEAGSTYCKVALPGYSLDGGDTTKEPVKCAKNKYSTGGAKTCTPCNTAKAEYTDSDGSTYCNICQGNIDTNGNCGAISCNADTIKLQGVGDGSFTFAETTVGTISKVNCKSAAKAKADDPAAGDPEMITRYCSYNSLTREGEWANADSSKCSSEYTAQVNEKVDAIKDVDLTKPKETLDAVNNLKDLAKDKAMDMAPKDLSNIADSLDAFTTKLASNKGEVSKEAAAGLADTVGAVAGVGEEKLSSVSDGEKTKMVDSVKSVVTSMKAGEKVETDTIAMVKVTAAEVEGEEISLPTPKNEKVSAPKLKMKKTPKDANGDTIAPTVAVFDKKTAEAIFPKPSATRDTSLTGSAASVLNVTDSIDSSIVSLVFEGSTALDFDIDIAVDTSGDSTNYESNFALTRTCKFYNTTTSEWATDGCTTTEGTASSGEVTYKCACKHNTSFAIILSAAEIADDTQSTVSSVLNAINIIFLAITFLCIVPFKQFRTRRLMQIQTQLCFALLVGHIAFILLGTTNSNSGVCLPGVIIVQYLFLVAVAWSVCASVTLYEKIVNALKSFGKQDKHYFVKCLTGCWGAPLFMILATYVSAVAMDNDAIPYLSSTGELDDEKTQTCWVASPWKWVGFIIPVYLCLALNVVLFFMIARIIVKAGKSGSNASHAREVKALVSISTTVCLPWLVALLMTGPKVFAQIFQWVFIIVTSIQGPTMFICFVVFQEDVLSNLFGLVGKEPPKILLAPKSSKSAKSAASEVSNVRPTTTAAVKKNEQSDIVNIKNPEYNTPAQQPQENIYSKVDEEAPPPQEDNVSRTSRSSGKHLYESTSFTQHGEKGNDIDPVPAVEQDETYENGAANDLDIVQNTYPHVPQLV